MLFFGFETVEILLKPANLKQKAMLTIELKHVFCSRKKLMKPLFISMCSSWFHTGVELSYSGRQ